MIRIFTGDDRVKVGVEIRKILGEKYEVIDTAELTKKDLPSIFLGTTLFDTKRRIVLRDFSSNAEVYAEITKYLNSPHEIVLFEMKLDKRTVTYKEIKDKVEIREFKLPAQDFRRVFDIYKVAKKDGKKAVEMLREIETDEDPIRFTGLLVSQALKDFQARPLEREKEMLKRLAQLDMQMKSSKIESWTLVEGFLIGVKR